MDGSQRNNCLKTWVFKNKHYKHKEQVKYIHADQCSFSLFFVLTASASTIQQANLTWSYAGKCSFFLSFEEVFVR